MKLRDEFAIAVMQEKCDKDFAFHVSDGDPWGNRCETIAREAYALADAMLAERDKK